MEPARNAARRTGMRRTVGAIAGCGLLAAASFLIIQGTSTPKAEAPGLTPFDSCDTALRYLKDEPSTGSGRTGLDSRSITTSPPERGRPRPARTPAVADAAESGGDAGGYSTTNVQETGVDEPDAVKTDGKILATAVDDTVRIYDVPRRRRSA